MAGAGYRTWTAGEVVTATNVQTYLQDQTVGVYAGTAARSSAILSPSEGQVSYRTDDDIVEVYDGSGWVPVSAPSDSGLVHINTVSFSAVANQSFNDVFTSTYKNYFVTFELSGSSGANTGFRLRASGADESGSIYDYFGIQGNSNSNTINAQRSNNASSFTLGRIDSSGGMASGYIYFFNPQETAVTGIIRTTNGYDSTPQLDTSTINGNTGTTTTSYDGFSFLGNGANMTGTVKIYGLR